MESTQVQSTATPVDEPIVPQQDAASTTDEIIPAKRWNRFWAAVVDSLVLGLFIFPLVALFNTLNGYPIYNDKTFDVISESHPWFAFLLLGLTLAYFTVLTSKYGGPPAKNSLYKIKVVRFGTREHISYGRALAREASKLLYNVPIIGGVLYLVSAGLVLFSKDRRALHDMAAGTQVIQK